ncbi:proline dehydrogenase [Onygenales sp. PD_40]|nr:proline dehydrogenase [Onygenales sp. PD_40]KAK2806858.1 proline dehydrogenase [Onygenales sp. PD_10]
MRGKLTFQPANSWFLISPRHHNASLSPAFRQVDTVRYTHNGPRQQANPPFGPGTGSGSGYATTNPTAPFTAHSPPPPLSIFPLSKILRSLCVTTISSSPILFTPSLTFLSAVAGSKSPLLSPDHNPILKTILSQTLYAQFCAGETPAEVKVSINSLKKLGFRGVILGYAKEIVMDEKEIESLGSANDDDEKSLAAAQADISSWKQGTLATVDLADAGDFVAIKFTGAGKGSLRQLVHRQPPLAALEQGMVEICERAKARNVRLLIDAEQQAFQPAIDDWALGFQRRYNRGGPAGEGGALVYGTYQAYLRSTPATLRGHMAVAAAEGFSLGVKLVRGAYLGTEARELIWDRKDGTDRAYDDIAESLIRRRYGGVLRTDLSHESSSSSETSQFPTVDLVLASHNRVSVQRALAIRNEQMRAGSQRIEMAYGQLSGMADDISCELVQRGKLARERNGAGAGAGGADGLELEVPKAYKYLVWGSVGECTRYLLRRAEENRDAAARTEETRRAMGRELWRRVRGGFYG